MAPAYLASTWLRRINHASPSAPRSVSAMSLSISAASDTSYSTSPSADRVIVANSTAPAPAQLLVSTRWDNQIVNQLLINYRGSSACRLRVGAGRRVRFSAERLVLSNDLLITFTTRDLAASNVISSLRTGSTNASESGQFHVCIAAA